MQQKKSLNKSLRDCIILYYTLIVFNDIVICYAHKVEWIWVGREKRQQFLLALSFFVKHLKKSFICEKTWIWSGVCFFLALHLKKSAILRF